jgi:recombination protein RecA
MTKEQAIETLSEGLNRVMGEGTIRMGSDPSLVVKYIPTGVVPVDLLLKGGLPRGRFTEIFGDFSTLKSYVAYRALAQVQKAGGKAVLVDTEHAFDPAWYKVLGGNADDLVVQQPAFGEQAAKAVEYCVRQNADLVVWDSIAATNPKSAMETDPTTANEQPARLASFMSQTLRRLTAANSVTAILALNQTRTNVGITFGSSEVVPGGKSLPFYASYRMSFRKAGRVQSSSKVWDGQKLVDTKQTDHMKIKVTLEKSKLNRPLRESWMLFDLTTGTVDEDSYLMGQGLETGLITRTTNGRWGWNEDGAKTVTEAQFRAELEGEDRDWLISKLMES